MDLTHHLAVVIGTTAAPTPQPDHVAAAGQAASQATESNNGTAADIASSIGPTGLLLLALMAMFAMYVVSLSLHPNVQVRLFNPFRTRGELSRLLELMGSPKRLNRRMHNKLWIGDNAAAVIGGRNLGAAYFRHLAERGLCRPGPAG